jgi:anthranilate phosphoribosyltransferase
VITDAIQKLVDRIDLDEAEARSAMEYLMTGQASDAQVASFLTALRMKGETAAELTAFARVMREKADPFWDGEIPVVLDTCGTGGDRSGTFNISTAAALVVAGAGVPVAKHGNRSASSLCGSADVLEALGVSIQMPLDALRKAVREVGMGFLFAPRFHRSMKHVMPARTQLKVRTVFNVIGPLAHPASPRFQVVGVFSPAVMDLVANALLGLKIERALVVHSRDGLDEISISAPTDVLEIQNGTIRSTVITPETFGVSTSSKQSLAGGDARTNAAIIEGVLKGERGPRRDIVLMNAGAALMIFGAASSLADGFKLAEESIDSGAAFRRLQQLREMSNEAA